MIEIWKDVKGYEGYYQVSNLGRVSSVGRIIKRSNGRSYPCGGDVLKLNIVRGYAYVRLYKRKKSKCYKIHRLVYEAFKGKLIDGHCIDHIDHNKQNNNVDNLRQVTNRQNSAHRKNPGTSKYPGVSWSKNRRKWTAQFTVKNKKIHVGTFTDEKEAANAYQNAIYNHNKQIEALINDTERRNT